MPTSIIFTHSPSLAPKQNALEEKHKAAPLLIHPPELGNNLPPLPRAASAFSPIQTLDQKLLRDLTIPNQPNLFHDDLVFESYNPFSILSSREEKLSVDEVLLGNQTTLSSLINDLNINHHIDASRINEPRFLSMVLALAPSKKHATTAKKLSTYIDLIFRPAISGDHHARSYYALISLKSGKIITERSYSFWPQDGSKAIDHQYVGTLTLEADKPEQAKLLSHHPDDPIIIVYMQERGFNSNITIIHLTPLLLSSQANKASIQDMQTLREEKANGYKSYFDSFKKRFIGRPDPAKDLPNLVRFSEKNISLLAEHFWYDAQGNFGSVKSGLLKFRSQSAIASRESERVKVNLQDLHFINKKSLAQVIRESMEHHQIKNSFTDNRADFHHYSLWLSVNAEAKQSYEVYACPRNQTRTLLIYVSLETGEVVTQYSSWQTQPIQVCELPVEKKVGPENDALIVHLSFDSDSSAKVTIYHLRAKIGFMHGLPTREHRARAVSAFNNDTPDPASVFNSLVSAHSPHNAAEDAFFNNRQVVAKLGKGQPLLSDEYDPQTERVRINEIHRQLNAGKIPREEKLDEFVVEADNAYCYYHKKAEIRCASFLLSNQKRLIQTLRATYGLYSSKFSYQGGIELIPMTLAFPASYAESKGEDLSLGTASFRVRTAGTWNRDRLYVLISTKTAEVITHFMRLNGHEKGRAQANALLFQQTLSEMTQDDNDVILVTAASDEYGLRWMKLYYLMPRLIAVNKPLSESELAEYHEQNLIAPVTKILERYQALPKDPLDELNQLVSSYGFSAQSTPIIAHAMLSLAGISLGSPRMAIKPMLDEWGRKTDFTHIVLHEPKMPLREIRAKLDDYFDLENHPNDKLTYSAQALKPQLALLKEEIRKLLADPKTLKAYQSYSFTLKDLYHFVSTFSFSAHSTPIIAHAMLSLAGVAKGNPCRAIVRDSWSREQLTELVFHESKNSLKEIHAKLKEYFDVEYAFFSHRLAYSAQAVEPLAVLLKDEIRQLLGNPNILKAYQTYSYTEGEEPTPALLAFIAALEQEDNQEAQYGVAEQKHIRFSGVIPAPLTSLPDTPSQQPMSLPG